MVRYSVVNQEVEEIVAYGDELIQMLSMAIAMNHLTMFASFPLAEDRGVVFLTQLDESVMQSPPPYLNDSRLLIAVLQGEQQDSHMFS